MTDCRDVRVREMLPEYMHEMLAPGERALVQLHLRGCEECREELAVLESCRRVMGVAPGVDVSRVVAALPTAPGQRAPGVQALRLTDVADARVSPTRRRGWGGAGGWRVAALALLTVGALGVAVVRGGHWPVASADGFAARVVEGGVPTGSPGAPTAPGGAVAGELPTLALVGGLGELSDASIGELLAEVELMEALPPEEPRPLILAGDMGIPFDEGTGGL